jgi:SAM-dependent methyltransferase
MAPQLADGSLVNRSREAATQAGQQDAADRPKLFDRLLRDARIRKVRPHVPPGAAVLDVGCSDGELLRRLGARIRRGVGIEPTLSERVTADNYELIPGLFPRDAPKGAQFNAITMLAVLEHIPVGEHPAVADSCAALLRPGGRVIITVPSPRVDDILHVLIRLHVISGMAAHEHYGFQPADTLAVFGPPRFRVLVRKTFQLGLNNLFVFERADASPLANNPDRQQSGLDSRFG